MENYGLLLESVASEAKYGKAKAPKTIKSTWGQTKSFI